MNKVGRPLVVTKFVLHKLEEAFAWGVDDETACFYANISPRSLYNYQEKHPEYLQRKKRFRKNLKLQGKVHLARQIKRGNLDIIKWYLERTDDEFKPKTKTEVEKKVLFGHLIKQIEAKNKEERIKYEQVKPVKIESLEKLKALVDGT